MKIEIIKTNTNLQSHRDTFNIAIFQILDGIIGIFTLGKYWGGSSSNEIIDVMSKNIEIRRRRRTRNANK